MRSALTAIIVTTWSVASGQVVTTDCYSYTPQSVSCRSQIPSQPALTTPNVMGAYLEGLALAERARVGAAQRRNLELQNELLKRQIAREQQADEDRRKAMESPEAALQADLQRFAARAADRRKSYADFDAVVGNPDLKITPFMVSVMADRHYPADIAYYLGKHPDEAEAISKMTRQEASWAIMDLDAKLGDAITSQNALVNP